MNRSTMTRVPCVESRRSRSLSSAAIKLLIASLFISTASFAQEISYNLEPSHQLGEVLWEIPVGGVMRMSEDGSKILAASIEDSVFYMVQTESGQYIELTAVNVPNKTFFVVDNDLMVLAETGGVAQGEVRVWDLGADTVLTTFVDVGPLLAVSSDLDLLVTSSGLYNLTSGSQVSEFPVGINKFAWVDEDRNRVYRSANNVLAEIDATTGEELRTWTIRATRSQIRRPANSNWVYVFATESNTIDGENWVEAINLVTNEHLKFSEYFWKRGAGQPEFKNDMQFFSVANDGAHLRGINGRHENPIWFVSAESRVSQVIADFEFDFFGERASKMMVISPDRSFVVHGFFIDVQESLTCNALIPTTTAIENNDESSNEQRLIAQVSENQLQISMLRVVSEISRVKISTLNGETVWSEVVSGQDTPILIPIGSLANGAYLCTVDTSEGTFSSTIAIQR